MSYAYNLDDIKKKINKTLADNEACLKAWESVTFPTKKDGKPFANMAKNIEGATYTAVKYSMQPGEYELTIYTHSSPSGYIHETIQVYQLVRYLKKEEQIAKTQNYMPKQSYLEQVYKYDLDDIKQAIAEHIEYLKDYIADLKKQLDMVDDVFTTFKTAFDNAIKILNDSCAELGHTYPMQHLIKECVIKKY